MDMVQGKKESEVSVFGIKKLEVFRPGKALSLESCGAQGNDSKVKNRFRIEQV